MARASTPTLLSLDRWAEIVGINPAHFNEAVGTSIMPQLSACGTVFWQYPWQSAGRVSREEIAREIAIAEEEIATVLGYWPAPTYIQELLRYPGVYRKGYHSKGRDIAGRHKALNLNYGRFIQGGRRNVQLVEAGATVSLTDEDGDGYAETATITATTELTDPCKVKVYFADKSGAPEWEVRPARSKSISGTTFTATFWAWQLIDPDQWEELPTEPQAAAENLTDSIYVSTVDVYREYTDYAQPSAVFFWEKEGSCGSGTCNACTLEAQAGCLQVNEASQGIARAHPGSYSDGAWTEVAFSSCRDPDLVKVYYETGEISQRYLAGNTCDPLSDYMAQTIAWLSLARLSRPLCGCNQVNDLARNMQADFAASEPNAPLYTMSESDLDNPFGTRRGEIRAWRRVNKVMRQKARFAVI